MPPAGATPTRPHPRRASGVPARWRSAPPAQRRSRETMERFAEATEELLCTRTFEEISIQDIVRRAGRPIGSFYARFASKEALLPFLYRRYHERLESSFTSGLARIDWEALDFERTVRALVDFLIGGYDERRWLIRALALFARMRPEALPADVVPHRRRIFDLPIGILIRHRARIAHADPEAAIRFGVFLVSSAAREKILFAQAPHARVTPISRTGLRDELARALYSYLSAGSPR
jgi:AcrR family transcriptional regulator